jgi:fluoride exporter
VHVFTLLSVALGGALGALSRYLLTSVTAGYCNTTFPLPTLLINILGCFLMGFIVEIAAAKNLFSSTTLSFLTTGFLGGFTTFSTFSLEAVLLFEKNHYFLAVSYIALSIILCIAAFFFGMKILR